VGLGEMVSSPIAPCFSILLYHGFCGDSVNSRLCVIYRRCRCVCAVVLMWHIETRLSQPRSEIRIRIRKHSDLFPVRPAVWISSAPPLVPVRALRRPWSPPPAALRRPPCTWAPSA
jgi:hypothetical protein